VIDGLKRRRLSATVDLLGEGVLDRRGSEEATSAYRTVLDRLNAEGLPSGISVKLTQLGLKIDAEMARENLDRLAEHAARLGRFVRIDMEDSSVTELTLAIYRKLRPRHANLGLALQAYLRRSEADVQSLLPLGPDIRLCKGIYAEPPEVAFQDPREIQESFLDLLWTLLEGGARVAIATHDPILIDEALRMTKRLDIGTDRHEFQMLLGVGEDLQSRIIAHRRRLRVYVPFGESWYPYGLRRLRENPRIAGYVFRNWFKRGVQAD